MKKIIKFSLIGTILIVISIGTIILISNPLRKSEENIREEILKLAPIGTNIENVTKLFEKKKEWKVYHQGGYIPWSSIPKDEISSYIDDSIRRKKMEVEAGKYISGIFNTHVYVYFKFNENLELIDVSIYKEIDAL